MAALAAAGGTGLQMAGQAGGTASNVIASDVNAKALDAQARAEERQAAFDETQSRRKSRLFLGEENAKVAASGVSLSSGSPLLHELDRVKQTEIEALNIRRRGEGQALQTRFQRRMVRRQIPWQIVGGVAQAGGSLLSGYASK